MDSISLAILVAVISSGATAAVVKAIDNWLSWKRERKAKREDSDLEKKEQTVNDMLDEISKEKDETKSNKKSSLITKNIQNGNEYDDDIN